MFNGHSRRRRLWLGLEGEGVRWADFALKYTRRTDGRARADALDPGAGGDATAAAAVSLMQGAVDQANLSSSSRSRRPRPIVALEGL